MTAPDLEVLRARFLTQFVRAAQTGVELSVRDIARLVRRNPYDLVRSADATRRYSELPIDERLQAYLRDVVLLLGAGYELFGDVEKTVQWFRGEQLTQFGGATPEASVAAGRAEEVRESMRVARRPDSAGSPEKA